MDPEIQFVGPFRAPTFSLDAVITGYQIHENWMGHSGKKTTKTKPTNCSLFTSKNMMAYQRGRSI